MAKLDTAAALSLGAQKGPYDKVPSLRFEEAAHVDFLGVADGSGTTIALRRDVAGAGRSPREIPQAGAVACFDQPPRRRRRGAGFPRVRCSRRWRPRITWKATHGASTARLRRASWRPPRRS